MASPHRQTGSSLSPDRNLAKVKNRQVSVPPSLILRAQKLANQQMAVNLEALSPKDFDP